MESFASRYHEENPDVFSCSDTAWVLAFGLMILNTDMYNRNIRVRDGCGGGTYDVPCIQEHVCWIRGSIYSNRIYIVDDKGFELTPAKQVSHVESLYMCMDTEAYRSPRAALGGWCIWRVGNLKFSHVFFF